MSARSSCVWTLLALSIASCAASRAVEDGGPSVPQRDGAVVEPTDAAGESGIAIQSPLPPCTDPVGSCPAPSVLSWQVLLDATEFGESARFIATGGQAVVIEEGSGAYRVARVRGPSILEDEAPPYSSRTFDAGALEPIAVAEAPFGSSADTATIVLACDEGARCALWRAAESDPGFVPWPESELPAGFVPRGLVVDDAEFPVPSVFCVFGNGLLCFEEGWVEAIAPSADLELNDVAIDSSWSLAVGDRGRWFNRERLASGELAEWREQPPLGAVDLAQASVNLSSNSKGAVIVGEGQLQAALGDQRELFGCSPRDDLVAVMLDPGFPTLAVASTGEIFQHAQAGPRRVEPYCAYQQLPSLGPVLDTGIAPCQDAINPRVLTERALYGVNVCVRLHD